GGNLFIQSAAPNLRAKVILDDSKDTQTGKQVTFNNDAVGWGISGLAPERIYLSLGHDPSGLDPFGSSVDVFGSSPPVAQSGGNTYALQSVPSGVNVVLVAGRGTDTVNVGSDPVNLSQSILDPIQGPVTVNGAGADTTVNFNDKGGTPGTAPNQVY